MNFHVMTLFPEMIEQGMNTSITGRAIAKGLLSLETINIRDYSVTGNGRIDDYPYGGGAGMVMQAEPIYRAYEDLRSRITDDPTKDTEHLRVIYLTPQGRVFHQEMAQEMAREEHLIFLCGHYEGVDERVIEAIVTDQVSIGDYVLTGGELPAMVMMDAISRMVPGVLSNAESGQSESFSDHLLEYPQYSRPEIWRGQSVPSVLLSGHHGNVDRWRREQSLLRTQQNRPELLNNADLSKGDLAFLESIKQKNPEKVQ
ncbi:MAG: tRNA (guanosine(37)-N1)-methyltransferase TrmD [Clostridiales bacterium]|nr:tRNA (guanosine(37)-N1)-methyltransferase TrmD [Clostridiales bacterium]